MGIVKALKWAAPSVLTIGALVCGLTVMRLSAEGNFGGCVQCIFCACLLDGLNCHTARVLGTSSAFEFELDSLCHLANFGVCPALVVHFWMRSLPEETSNLAQLIGCSLEGCGASREWAACCCHAGCCALRLACFNVQGHAEQMDNQHLHFANYVCVPGSHPCPSARLGSVLLGGLHLACHKCLFYLGRTSLRARVSS